MILFLHLTAGPNNVNNALAVVFAVLISDPVGAGSLWIMSNLDSNMMSTEQMSDMNVDASYRHEP